MKQIKENTMNESKYDKQKKCNTPNKRKYNE